MSLRRSSDGFDVIVVGAGPAGSSAALGLARRGARVLLLERGEYPGAKNMFGGMMTWCPAAEQLVPGFWERAPWERAVTRRVLTVVGQRSSTALVFQAESGSERPSVGAGSTSDRALTGFTLFRPQFDRWLADQAVAAGATLVTSTLADRLIVREGTVCGVRLVGSGEAIEAPLVVACDGALSLLAKDGGLHSGFTAAQVGLGVRALYALPEEVIDERFQLAGREGSTSEFLGCSRGVRGGGFIYTQRDSLSVGLVTHVASLKSRGIPPYELLDGFTASPPVARLLRGARLVEYSAHLLAEAGPRMTPRLAAPGILVAGDAAGFCYTNGLITEGMNLAMTSGLLAAETGAEALAAGDVSQRVLGAYEQRLRRSFVLRDLRTFRSAIHFLRHDRLFTEYPQVVGALMEGLYRSDGEPKQRIARLGLEAAKGRLALRRLFRDAIEAGRSYL
jgi:electron transfer flavoprotein-quinone oxidoreductase